MGSKAEYEATKARKIKVAEEQQTYAEKREAMKDLSDEVTMLVLKRFKQILNGECHLNIEKIPGQSGSTYIEVRLGGFPEETKTK